MRIEEGTGKTRNRIVVMRRNRTKDAHPSFTSRLWRVQFEQSPLTDTWVYKFPIAESEGRWTELAGKTRSAYRTIGNTVQFIEEIHGLNGRMWRALLAELQHPRPLRIEGVFEGVIFSADGRLHLRSIWITDQDAIRLKGLDENSMGDACPAGFERVRPN
jgi:hypothetical protein